MQRLRNRLDSGEYSVPGKLATRMLEYLRRMTTPHLVLWSYFIWYLAVVVQHFDASPSLWVNSLGMAGIMGTAYYLSIGAIPNVPRPSRWIVFRMYLMPFCVSSFAALIKGHGFILVFYPTLSENLLGLGLIGSFCSIVLAVKRLSPAARRETPELARAALQR